MHIKMSFWLLCAFRYVKMICYVILYCFVYSACETHIFDDCAEISVGETMYINLLKSWCLKS